MRKRGLNNQFDWHLREPFWRSKHVSGESLFFIRENPGEPARANLLFPPTGSLQISSASRETSYTANLDYLIDFDNGIVTLPETSRIPFTDRQMLYPDIGEERSIAHKFGEKGIGLYFSEGDFLHALQVEASYSHDSIWRGYRPEGQRVFLPRISTKLKERTRLNICVCGDSISAGANASGRTGARPLMPPYPELFAQELRRHSGGQVVLKNFAVGGKSVCHGLEVVGAITNEDPDLVIVAYGINDVGSTTPDQYLTRTNRIVDEIRATAPDTEIILVASMLGNPEWHNTPTEPFFAFRDALKTLSGPGIALADVTQVSADILGYKSYYDLTGNGVNHPNDFGHRIYAQVILDLLQNSATEAEQDASVDTDKPHKWPGHL